MKPSNELAVSLYRGMVEIREFELKAQEIFRSGKMPGFIHVYVGEEAIAVGVCAQLRTTTMLPVRIVGMATHLPRELHRERSWRN